TRQRARGTGPPVASAYGVRLVRALSIGSGQRRFPGRGASVALVTALVASMFALMPPAAHAAPTCTTTTAPAGYSVTACISAPANAAALTGSQTVSGTVSVAGTNPGVQRMVFYLDGTYLLTDY